MGPLFLALQLTSAPVATPPSAVPPAPPGYANPAYAPPLPYAPQPYPYGQYSQQYPYAYGQVPGYPAAAPPPAPKPKVPDRAVSWFVRLDIGIGPPAFSDETRLLHLEGYGGAKVWGFFDGGYFLHPNIGIGAWGALGSWSSHPSNAPGMSEASYFIGGEIPILLGTRSFSFVAAPRMGYATGQIEFAGDARFQKALGLGLDLSATSFKYHISGSLGFLRAAVGAPGEVGRDHDYGGFYLLIGGTFDG